VIVFADYQLLAAMGTLLEYLKAPPPVDAAPLDTLAGGFVPYKLPTIRVTLPQTGSEPLRVSDAAIGGASAGANAYAAVEPQDGFRDRWPRWAFAARMLGAPEWFAQKKGRSPESAVAHVDPTEQRVMSYAAAEKGKPFWLLTAFAPK
jgi:adhesin transport system outer membrane protein